MLENMFSGSYNLIAHIGKSAICNWENITWQFGSVVFFVFFWCQKLCHTITMSLNSIARCDFYCKCLHKSTVYYTTKKTSALVFTMHCGILWGHLKYQTFSALGNREWFTNQANRLVWMARKFPLAVASEFEMKHLFNLGSHKIE